VLPTEEVVVLEVEAPLEGWTPTDEEALLVLADVLLARGVPDGWEDVDDALFDVVPVATDGVPPV
jgi:hypothetical protein